MQIKGTNITMVRGDSETITVTMKTPNADKVDFVNGDTVYFTVKDNTITKTKIIQKVITDFIEGTALISLVPEDTKGLRAKDYVYDIQLTRDGDIVTTIVKPSKFTVLGDVTDE